MFLSCRIRHKLEVAAVTIDVNFAMVFKESYFRRKVEVVAVAYPMALRVLKVLIFCAARDEVPGTSATPVMTLRIGIVVLQSFLA